MGFASRPVQERRNMDSQTAELYKDRFENLFRVTKKITSCINMGDILEVIRDEVKNIIPHAQEGCLLLVDKEAPNYTRPLHCPVNKEQVNCRMCKFGKEITQLVLAQPVAFQCGPGNDPPVPLRAKITDEAVCELALPIYEGNDPLAVLTVVTEPGHVLSERDVTLLNDLAELATNTLISARTHAKIAEEKLSLERILDHIKTFVPETVRRIVEKNPEAPDLRKQEMDVSILFLDVADYTRISELLTQDKVNFIIEKYFSSFVDVIYARQGDINETAGDGLMAIFQGEPLEHAVNAARAALEIWGRTDQINKELKGRFHPLAVNMGINSGVAAVGMSRFDGQFGTRTTFTASGSTTNLAARLASVAKDGDILLGPETARRIGMQMTLFDRGTMSFKNIREKIHAYSLILQV